ncbi:MAG TPA: VanZ family protein, partial [Gemmatimonadales bacterium]|nr:VanZ family protein [Gemmatimonadales bacterium]
MSPPLPTRTWVDRARLPARAAYIVILLLATLTPFTYDPDPGQLGYRLARAFQPYISGMDVIDGARNVVLFAGWGVVWALTTAGNASRAVLHATITGTMISISVEAMQLLSSNRKTSILDVGTNTAGSFLGATGLILLIYLARERRGARSFVGIPTMLFAASYTAAVFFEAFSPLFSDGVIDGVRGGPFTRLQLALAAMPSQSLFEVTWSDLLLFTPAGSFLVAAMSEAGVSYRGAFWRTVGLGWFLVVLAELLHGGLGQRVELGAILLHGLSVMLGAWLALRYLARLTVALRGRNRVLALMLLYVAILVVWGWRPLTPEYTLAGIAAKFSGDWYKPLAGLSLRYDFFTVVDVCNQFLLYLPFGALL